MHILLSNDDGIYAQGISVLRRTLEDIAEKISVIAPDRERSASGHGITVHRPLRAKKIIFKKSKSRGWAVDGTPADCVKLGLEVLLEEPPDIVISGINLGPNLGTDILYSGTVSAALEALINNLPSMAVSLTSYKNPDFTYAALFMKKIIPVVMEEGLPKGTLLNINIPPGIPRGLKITRLGQRRYINVFQKRTDPRGRDYFWTAGEPINLDQDDPQTDVKAINDGYISITPVHFDLTNYSIMEKLKIWSTNIPVKIGD